jgi:hypothetical protein
VDRHGDGHKPGAEQAQLQHLATPEKSAAPGVICVGGRRRKIGMKTSLLLALFGGGSR